MLARVHGMRLLIEPEGKSHCGSEKCGQDVYSTEPCECYCETRCAPWNDYLERKGSIRRQLEQEPLPPLPPIGQYIAWAWRGKCLRCGGERAEGSTRCALHRRRP
jgi:hypothetical protein